MTQPTRIRPGAKALIVNDGKILVIKEELKINGSSEIIHDFPGGGIDLGETCHETLKREVFEEVGLTIEIDRPIGCWDFMSKMRPVHIVCLAYQCHIVGNHEINFSNNPAEGENIFEAFWITPQEIIEQKLFKTKDIIKAVENVRI